MKSDKTAAISQALARYASFILLTLIALFALRLIEWTLIAWHWGTPSQFIKGEIGGLLYDTLLACSLLIPLAAIFISLHLWKPKLPQILFIGALGLFSFITLIITPYFIYERQALDTFFWHYSIAEMTFTIRGSTIGFLPFLLAAFAFAIVFSVSSKKLFQCPLPRKMVILVWTLTLLAAPLFLFVKNQQSVSLSPLSRNKTTYFLSRSLEMAFSKKERDQALSPSELKQLAKIFFRPEWTNTRYPLQHPFKTSDFLGPQIPDTNNKPNIVIILVEGLSQRFVDSFHGHNWMPFVSSLAQKSLYWNNALSLGERSFAVLPSLIGSLPYGSKGFTLQTVYPHHQTLIKILRNQGYQTSFFYGQGAWFHRKNEFLKYNQIHRIIDCQTFPDSYPKIITGENFFWGYNDHDLFQYALNCTPNTPTPRLDIFFTGTMHPPFRIANQQKLEQDFQQKLQHTNPSDKKFLNQYKEQFLSLLFTDEALKFYFQQMALRPDYHRTVFILTGDHAMSEIPPANRLACYQVPLIIYAPGIQARKSSEVVSHLDVYPSLLAFLANKGLQIPPQISALGTDLSPHPHRCYALMNGSREITEAYADGYFFSEKTLFQVDSLGNPNPCQNDSITQIFQQRLSLFRQLNLYLCHKNRLQR